MVSPPRPRSRTTPTRVETPQVAETQPEAHPPGFLERIAANLRAGTVRVVEGVRYRERRGRAIKGLLHQTADAVREYEVRFPGSDRRERPMRIRATRARIYDDLNPDPRAELVRRLDDVVRPGDRVLHLGSGTGASAKRLAYLVGPSGGVVALDRDGESVRFARQRYTDAQTGYELGWIETLSGELDGAFDAVVAVDPLRDTTNQIERARSIAEILRVVRQGGHLLCVGSSSESWELARRSIEDGRLETLGEPLRSGDWRASLFRKPDANPRQDRSAHREPR